MELEGWWQENKGFALRVGAGALAFLVGLLAIDAAWAGELEAQSRRLRGLERELAGPAFGAAERDRALEENRGLHEVVDTLVRAVRFEPREALRLDLERGSAASQYLRSASDVRERVLVAAGRAGLAVDPGLGLPRLSPTREEEIERTLEALDAIETVLDAAIEARVRRVEDVRIRLDAAEGARAGTAADPDGLELTLVDFSLLGGSRALAEVLESLRRPSPDEGQGASGGTRVLCVREARVAPARGRSQELRLELTVVLPRLAGPARPEREGDG